MNIKRIFPVVCALLLSASACHSANTTADSTSVANSDTTITDTAPSYPDVTDYDETYTRTYKGTIGDEQVVINDHDLNDALDDRGSKWRHEGTLTFSSSDRAFKLKGYTRHQYFFFDAYNAKGEIIGHLDFEGTADGYEGTYTDLKTGNELNVDLKDVK